MFAFAQSDDQVEALADRMATRFQDVAGLESDSYVGKINVRGAHRVAEE